MKNKLQILLGCVFALVSGSIFSQGKLQITDVSFPNPMDLNVGNVGEYVYAIQNTGHIGSKIDSIFFKVSANPNIEFYPIGSPVFYLTDPDSLLTNYNTIYT